MYAVVKTGGKQYKVVADSTLTVEKIEGEAGQTVQLPVLMAGSADDTKIGAPFVEGLTVTAEIVEQTRGPKLINFKKRRRQNSKRTKGHRQDLTVLKVVAIGGEATKAKTKKAKASAEPAAEQTA